MRQTATILIVTTIMLASSLNGNAQKRKERHPMLEGNPEWVYYSYNCGYMMYKDFFFTRFYIDGDTVLGGNKVYKKLWYDIYDAEGNHLTLPFWNVYYQYNGLRTTPFVCGFIRQDGSRVYAYCYDQHGTCLSQRDGANTERFIYDFSLQKGDTLILDYCDSGSDEYIYKPWHNERPILDRFPVTLADGTTRDMIQLFFCNPDTEPWKECPGYHDNYITTIIL